MWDLKYISTSDEEDNDSSEEEDEDEEEEEEKKQEPVEEKVESPREGDPKKLWKTTPGKNEGVPQIAQKLRPAKKKQRIYYAYTYDNQTQEGGAADPKKVKVIRKRVERR